MNCYDPGSAMQNCLPNWRLIPMLVTFWNGSMLVWVCEMYGGRSWCLWLWCWFAGGTVDEGRQVFCTSTSAFLSCCTMLHHVATVFSATIVCICLLGNPEISWLRGLASIPHTAILPSQRQCAKWWMRECAFFLQKVKNCFNAFLRAVWCVLCRKCSCAFQLCGCNTGGMPGGSSIHPSKQPSGSIRKAQPKLPNNMAIGRCVSDAVTFYSNLLECYWCYWCYLFLRVQAMSL